MPGHHAVGRSVGHRRICSLDRPHQSGGKSAAAGPNVSTWARQIGPDPARTLATAVHAGATARIIRTDLISVPAGSPAQPAISS